MSTKVLLIFLFFSDFSYFLNPEFPIFLFFLSDQAAGHPAKALVLSLRSGDVMVIT